MLFSAYAAYYMDEGIQGIKDIIDNPAYSRGYKYSLHALIDMSIKYFDILGKSMDVGDVKYIQEKIMLIPKVEMDSYMIEGIKKYILYCQEHNYEKICEPIIMNHYENISNVKKATAEDYLIENLDWED